MSLAVDRHNEKKENNKDGNMCNAPSGNPGWGAGFGSPDGLH
jgi:hypothetical protein